jgi:hypothetical protein
MENEDVMFSKFINKLNLNKFKIIYSRVEDKNFIYVKTIGLTNIGLKEIFTVSKSPDLKDAGMLIKVLVKGMLDTDQKEGIRSDILKHPITKKPLRCILKKSSEEDSIIVLCPDKNNKLPGEIGYIKFL